MTDTQIKFTLLCIVLLSTRALGEFILEDLIAMEDNQRAIHNIGDETREGIHNSHDQRPLVRPVRQKTADEETSEKSNSDKEKPKESDDDEERKTLAQQVADGKYGLIQTEIFNDKPQRPGIISYEVNPEVPKDNVNNLGGLKSEEIWLAENHLLVLGGGGFGEEGREDARKNGRPIWPPIDNYVAPERQVKIPPNPKVPPPFPVQLRPGGPVEFLRGENGTGGPPPLPPFPGFFPPPGNFSSGNAGPFGPFPPPFPFPPPQQTNGSFIPPPPQFLANLPPGAGFLPPPPPGGVGNNFTFDEDDPSIYYPPPYDFVYPRDNSSIVPAGPLVPGIVLPPPPDFFAPLNERPAAASQARTRTRKPPTPRPPTKKPAKYNYATHSAPTHSSKLQHTTKRPSVQIISDEKNPEHINEVTPSSFPHALPPNAVVQGWLPIPAPRPFYITGPRKPYSKQQQQPPENTTPPVVIIKERRPTSSQIYSDDGYYYNKPKLPPSSLSKEQNTHQEDNYTPTKLIKLGGDNPTSLNIYNPALYNNPLYITSTVPPPVPYHNTPRPQPQSGKALKTFYFYEEPQDISTTVRPPVQSNYYSTPLPDSAYYLPQEQHRYVHNKYELPPLRANILTSTRAPPVNYFYITEAPPKAVVTTSSRKPPVYEYSYTAPGYGTLEAPKVGTPTPPLGISHASINNQIPDDNNYNYYDDYLDHTTPRTPITKQRYNNQAHNIDSSLGIVKNSLIYTTERPVYRPPATQTRAPPRGYVYSTTQAPLLSTTASPFVIDHQTQNPYYAFFTHHDAGLIDDITKKYFTIFGQKLNNNQNGGSTTPLTPTEHDYDSVTRKPVKYNRVTPTPQPPRLQQYYYSTPAPQSLAYYDYDYYDSVERINANQRLPTGQKAQYNYDRDGSAQSHLRPPSLEHDTDVNYKNQQHLPIEADAEVIDTNGDLPLKQRAEQLQVKGTPIGSSLISYSLPGNGGGHFYFLTPQSIQNEAEANGYAAYNQQQQQQLGPLYYSKRNAHAQRQQQQPISSSLVTSSSNSNSQKPLEVQSSRRRQNKRRQHTRQQQHVQAT